MADRAAGGVPGASRDLVALLTTGPGRNALLDTPANLRSWSPTLPCRVRRAVWKRPALTESLSTAGNASSTCWPTRAAAAVLLDLQVRSGIGASLSLRH